MAVLTPSTTEQATNYAVAATRVYVPLSQGLPALALRIIAPTGNAPDAYYQELFGISVAVLASRTTPLNALLDCPSAITQDHQSLFLLESAVGHLQHGPLLLGVRPLSSSTLIPLALTWTPSHTERKKSLSIWTD